MHPRSKHWHLISFVIIRKKDRQDVQVTKSMCGADCWTDSRLIICKMILGTLPKRCPPGETASKHINISNGKKLESSNSWQKNWRTWLSISRSLTTLRAAGPHLMYSMPLLMHYLVPASRIQLLEEKHGLQRMFLTSRSPTNKTNFYNFRNTLQRKLGEMQDNWKLAKSRPMPTWITMMLLRLHQRSVWNPTC